MIELIEVLNYRCLRHVRQRLGHFHVLIGPNASGKTTFLDVVGFLSDLVSKGIDAAISNRARKFQDLTWNHDGDWFELVLEATIPEDRKTKLQKKFDLMRYEIRIGGDGILEEKLWLKPVDPEPVEQRTLFPIEPDAPETILTGKGTRRNWQRVLSKAQGGNDNFYVEVRGEGKGKGWFPSIRLGPRRSALANLPADEAKFPVATWFTGMLAEGVHLFAFNSLLMRMPSPPRQTKGLNPDGSNLPWVIHQLEQPEHRERFQEWIQHLRTALPELETIKTVERPEDRHRYLVIRNQGGLEVPSWTASDGTLRLLALTIPAYLPDFQGICLIEEPENGLHPQAVETVLQSLSSVYHAQMIMATHSPVVLSVTEAKNVLCFKKTESGATAIVTGNEHPGLKDWKGDVNLGVLFAGGVLG